MRDWETCYQKGETPWDKGSAAPPLVELIERLGTGLWGGGTVLVPGCGLGHDVRCLAGRGLKVIGLDLSKTAVEKARSQPPLGDESYETGDFLSADWAAGKQYSAIWEHTCFCAISPTLRGDYAQSAAEVLPEGAILAGVFYLKPFDPGEDNTGPPFMCTIEELDHRFSPYFERLHGWVPENAYPGREGREWIAVYRKLPAQRVAGETGSR